MGELDPNFQPLVIILPNYPHRLLIALVNPRGYHLQLLITFIISANHGNRNTTVTRAQ
jgi:hypothetical protein